jgi:hypothetical protein
MQPVFKLSGRILLGLLTGTACAFPQAYTISAKPGAVNYIEGPVSINGNPITANQRRMFVNANDTLATGDGSKAEMLLTPGVFVRLGSASSVKMISPSLADTAIEVIRGEVVVEVAEFEKENNLRVLDHGVPTKIEKIGVYRFETDPAAAQVFSGKAEVGDGDRHVELGKDRQVLLAEGLKAQKFDAKKAQDDLYAWSEVRDQYVAAASYSAAKNVSTFSNSFDGFGGYYGPGWFWNSGWNSFAWLPGEGAFFSPFGYGYFSPYAIAYAPVVYLVPIKGTRPVPVPVNPARPLVINGVTSKPVVAGGAVARASFSGVSAGGGHVSSAVIAHASSPSSYSGGGYSGGSSGGGGRAVSSSASSSMSSGSAHASSSSGGGGHH